MACAAQVRKKGILKWVRPDGKTQVVVEYRRQDGRMIPIRVHTVLISTQHDEDVSNEQIYKDVLEHIIKVVIPAKVCDRASARACRAAVCYYVHESVRSP